MDKRKENGGHSTKAKEGKIDKRKNKYRDALDNAHTEGDVEKVINMVRDKALKEKDIQAGKLYLEYYVGKPKEGLDITTDGEMINIPVIRFKTSEE
jgi:hypothetical protein|tara:strand:- start:474 stop:761 length:288 start_codon:yes stop_codon:yes gene_type:complete